MEKKMLAASGERREIFVRFENGEMNFLTMPTPEIQS